MLTGAHEGPRPVLVVAARRRAARALDFPARYVGAHGSGCAANWEPPPPMTAKAVAADPMRPLSAAADRRAGLCGGSTRPCHAHVRNSFWRSEIQSKILRGTPELECSRAKQVMPLVCAGFYNILKSFEEAGWIRPAKSAR